MNWFEAYGIVGCRYTIVEDSQWAAEQHARYRPDLNACGIDLNGGVKPVNPGLAFLAGCGRPPRPWRRGME